MIALFTDFGLHGPYTGQMKAVLHQMAPGIPAIDLFADAPVGNPKASAYLLAAYAGWFPAGIVFLCVVDPGVGGARPSIILEADGGWYVGPATACSSWSSAVPKRRVAGGGKSEAQMSQCRNDGHTPQSRHRPKAARQSRQMAFLTSSNINRLSHTKRGKQASSAFLSTSSFSGSNRKFLGSSGAPPRLSGIM